MAKINDAYDIGAAFEAIEDELIASMIRNMKRHKVEEVTENKQWSMWQAEQLKALEQYRRSNRKKFGGQFQDINDKIEALIRMARTEGNMHQELQILNAIKKGFPAKKISKGATAEFFRLNDRKLDALINATTNDMEKAEVAVLRMADDQYRRVIYNAQVYANTGAGTYEKAVDMATKDFLSAGLNCIEYKNGARHTLADYADMAIRTASKRAYLQGEGEKRQEWGIHTVIVNKRGNPCPKCLPFCGKVLIDDVWSGGSRKDGSYPLLSKAISYGLYHPRCKDGHTTYFPGISTADDTWTKEELENIGLENQQEARQQYAERQGKKYDRLAENSLDAENQKRYAARREEYYRRRKNKVLRDDPEYQEHIRKRREEYQKKHPTKQNTEPQIDKEALKQEIAGMDQQQASLKEQLQKVKEEEKSLTQKVYFDMSGTAEEKEQLKGMSAKKKEIEAQISELNKQIWKKQEVYKNDVEKGEKIPDQIAEVIEEAKKRAGAKTVAKEAGSGIIKHNRFNTNADPIREVIGSAEQSHPEELKKIMEDLEASGVKVRRRENAMGYMPALSAGKPGEIIVEEGASYSAWLHEYKHFIDDRNDGYPGMRILENREKCIQREKDAYAIEIEFAKSYGRDDIVKRLEELRDEEVKRWQT